MEKYNNKIIIHNISKLTEIPGNIFEFFILKFHIILRRTNNFQLLNKYNIYGYYYYNYTSIPFKIMSFCFFQLLVCIIYYTFCIIYYRVQTILEDSYALLVFQNIYNIDIINTNNHLLIKPKIKNLLQR